MPSSKGMLVWVVSVFLGSPSASAYEYELSGSYKSVEANAVSAIEIGVAPGTQLPPGFPTLSKTFFEADDEQTRLSVTYFIKPVAAADGPTQELSFLGMVSSVSLSYASLASARTSRTTDLLGSLVVNDSTVLSDSKFDEHSFGLRFVTPNTNWIGDIGYARHDMQTVSDDLATRFETDIDHYKLGIGRYIRPQTTLIAVYDRADQTARQIITTSNGDDVAQIELRSETITLEARHLLAAGSRSHIALESSLGASSTSGQPYIIDDWYGVYDLGATLYPVDPLAISINVSGTFETSALAADEINYSMDCRWFYTESFAIGFGYQFTDFDSMTDIILEDRDGYFADITMRF